MNIFDQSTKLELKRTCLLLGLALYFENQEEYDILYNKIKEIRKQINDEILKSMQNELSIEPQEPIKHLMSIEEFKTMKIKK